MTRCDSAVPATANEATLTQRWRSMTSSSVETIPIETKRIEPRRYPNVGYRLVENRSRNRVIGAVFPCLERHQPPWDEPGQRPRPPKVPLTVPRLPMSEDAAGPSSGARDYDDASIREIAWLPGQLRRRSSARELRAIAQSVMANTPPHAAIFHSVPPTTRGATAFISRRKL